MAIRVQPGSDGEGQIIRAMLEYRVCDLTNLAAGVGFVFLWIPIPEACVAVEEKIVRPST